MFDEIDNYLTILQYGAEATFACLALNVIILIHISSMRAAVKTQLTAIEKQLDNQRVWANQVSTYLGEKRS